MAAVLASAFFATVSGSAPATVVAVGSGMIVGMVQSGYTRKQDMPRQQRASFNIVVKTFREALWGLMFVVIILGGIYAGVFTPTEAAAVSAVYAFIIAVFVYRDITIHDVPNVLIEASRITVMLMFVIASAIMFAFLLTTEQIPHMASEFIVELGLPVLGFLLVLNLLLLITGNFMEPTSGRANSACSLDW